MKSVKVGWYVIYTNPRHEKKVVEYLEQFKLQHFLPTTRTLKVWSGRKKYVQLPLFPSYVFVKLDSIVSYFDSLQIPGVLHYVRTGNQIAEVQETVIDKLQSIGNSCNVEVSEERFSEGRILKINEGPFTGFPCEVVQHKGMKKILVRIELLQRNVLIDLPARFVEAIA